MKSSITSIILLSSIRMTVNAAPLWGMTVDDLVFRDIPASSPDETQNPSDVNPSDVNLSNVNPSDNNPSSDLSPDNSEIEGLISALGAEAYPNPTEDDLKLIPDLDPSVFPREAEAEAFPKGPTKAEQQAQIAAEAAKDGISFHDEAVIIWNQQHKNDKTSKIARRTFDTRESLPREAEAEAEARSKDEENAEIAANAVKDGISFHDEAVKMWNAAHKDDKKGDKKDDNAITLKIPGTNIGLSLTAREARTKDEINAEIAANAEKDGISFHEEAVKMWNERHKDDTTDNNQEANSKTNGGGATTNNKKTDTQTDKKGDATNGNKDDTQTGNEGDATNGKKDDTQTDKTDDTTKKTDTQAGNAGDTTNKKGDDTSGKKDDTQTDKTDDATKKAETQTGNGVDATNGNKDDTQTDKTDDATKKADTQTGNGDNATNKKDDSKTDTTDDTTNNKKGDTEADKTGDTKKDDKKDDTANNKTDDTNNVDKTDDTKTDTPDETTNDDTKTDTTDNSETDDNNDKTSESPETSLSAREIAAHEILPREASPEARTRAELASEIATAAKVEGKSFHDEALKLWDAAHEVV